jgi:uncharacterized protein YwbE
MAIGGIRRTDIKPGFAVMVELTKDKHTGRLTLGRVKEVLISLCNTISLYGFYQQLYLPQNN